MGNVGSHARERHRSGEALTVSVRSGREVSSSEPTTPTKHEFSNNDHLLLPNGTSKKGRSRPKPRLKHQLSDPTHEKLSKDSIDELGRSTSSGLQQDGHDEVPGVGQLVPNMFKWRYYGKKVFLMGSFNKWKRIRMRRSRDEFVAIVNLPVGVHEYRFLVDGHWRLQDGNHAGERTNVITVAAPDADFLAALDEDAAEVEREKSLLDSGCSADHHGCGRMGYQRQISTASEVSHNHEAYGQVAPSYSDWDDTLSPPTLAPYLNHPILNTELPLSWHPDMLPEPTSHSIMRHMYVMAIQDSVIAMSATHRYRRKYITTLFYKPLDDEEE